MTTTTKRCTTCGQERDATVHKVPTYKRVPGGYGHPFVSESSQSTTAAMRAAQAINLSEGDVHYEDDIEAWAEIIDRETALPEMLNALEDIYAQMNGLEGRQYKWIRERCAAAIRKAHGEQ